MFKFFMILLLASQALAISCRCGSTLYSQQDINNGIQKGTSVNNNPQSFGGSYPHRFGNREGVQFVGCGPGAPFIEYPLKQGSAYVSGPPGADRVVYNGGTRAFCGCMTHTGAPTANGFVSCTHIP